MSEEERSNIRMSRRRSRKASGDTQRCVSWCKVVGPEGQRQGRGNGRMGMRSHVDKRGGGKLPQEEGGRIRTLVAKALTKRAGADGEGRREERKVAWGVGRPLG